MEFTTDEISRMYAPFQIADHSIREGNRTSGGKIQWFVYLERGAIQRRLEEIFPFQWGVIPTEATEHADKSFSANAVITIRGLARGSNGAQSEMHGEHTPKGAVTDAFRRAASMWGVGLYLYDNPAKIYTDGYTKGDWDTKKLREKEALEKFSQWHKRRFGTDKIIEITKTETPLAPSNNGERRTMTSPPQTDGSGAIESGLLATKVKYIQSGSSKFLAFNTDNRARLYGRDKLWGLGDNWREWSEKLQPGDADADAVDLPGMILLTTERKVNQSTGDIYHLVTGVELAGEAG